VVVAFNDVISIIPFAVYTSWAFPCYYFIITITMSTTR